MTWNPTQYLAFEDHRLRPVFDLLSRVPAEDPDLVLDLGCGAGNGSKILRRTWPDAGIIGVDNSPDMLEHAREEAPDISFVEADIGRWTPPRPVDVLFSNAALHWLDDHATLFPALASHVKPGGYFAVQLPANFRQPSHTLIDDVAREGPWRDKLTPLIQDSPTKEPGFYYDLMTPVAAALDIWQIEYLQVLQGDNPVAEFTKGSWLAPFLQALDEPERSAFENEYRARVSKAYPRRDDGATLFPFRRLFIVAKL